MRRYGLTVIIICLVASFVVIQPKWISEKIKPVLAQTRRRDQKPRPEPRKTGIDYSRFSHATKEHQEDCSKCHNIPTQNWKTARTFPDVADYPDHDTCVRCHREQFFKGVRPVICTICHTVVSPRGDARLAFRNPNDSRQFTVEFPHDKHQDVIASLHRRSPGARPVIFLRASLAAHGRTPIDEKKKVYNNCEICHRPRTKAVVAPPGGWLDSFAPGTDAFKASPETHGFCFNCHWKAQGPKSDKCDGCHKLAAAPYTAQDWPTRISMKFRHSREQHIAECTTCHINITKAASLRGLKPDVPITACSECHNKPPTHLEISGELEQLDKNRAFVCVYCHTSNVGSRDAPASHYLVAERAPVQRKDLK